MMITDRHITKAIYVAIAGLIMWTAYSQHETKKSMANLENLLQQNEVLNTIRTVEFNNFERKLQ